MKKIISLNNFVIISLITIAALCFALYKFNKIANSFTYIKEVSKVIGEQTRLIVPDGKNISERFLTPSGYKRLENPVNSFAYYLQHLPLKKHGSDVLLYNGNVKYNKVHEAVINIDVGNKDLQQCADAVMRLRAEYLYKEMLFSSISFNFTSGFAADYSRWRNGERIKVYNNNCSWYSTSHESNNYASFRNYLDLIFTYAGTLSLSKQLKEKNINNVQAGDIFIQAGSPGHAIIVVDVCMNHYGEKLIMLAQSYMPAQEIHILKNTNDSEISPWYKIKQNQQNLNTPEWTFKISDLKSF